MNDHYLTGLHVKGDTMPTISVEQSLLAKLMSENGCPHDIEDIDHRLPLLGTDIDSCNEETLDIEIFPDRPDLLSGETLSVAMISFLHNKPTLEDLALTGHQFPNLILEWRQISKLKSTYTDALQDHINKKTKRVHTSFLLAATNTGRLASSDPNLQNIPIKSEDGKDIRKAFKAQKGHLLISADYNQIEMRILADLADVKELKKAFKNNEDIHSLTASQIFNIDIKKIDQDQRRKAKAINCGIIYGISQYGLAKQINVSNYEAEEFLNAYFAKFPEIKVYMESTIKFCRKSGYVNNIFGRRSHFNGINDKNFNVRNFQERASINAPIQGSASEIMRLAMIRLDQKFKSSKNTKSKILLQIHDELIFEVPEKEVKTITKIIKEEMTSVTQSDLHSFSTPLTVDVNIGDNWGILH